MIWNRQVKYFNRYTIDIKYIKGIESEKGNKNRGDFFLLFFLNAHGFAEEIIRLTNGEWPPWQSKEIKCYGLASRIVTDAFALEGVKVEYGFFPWKRAYKLAEVGAWDGTLVWNRKPEREKNFYYSDPVLYGSFVFFHLRNFDFDWKKITDLKGFRVGATMGYNYGEMFSQAEQSKLIHVIRNPTDEANFERLLKGYVHIFPQVMDIAYYSLRKNFRSNEVELITHHNKPFHATSYHLLLAKKIAGNKRLLRLFNKGLRRLKDSGKLDQYIAESRMVE